jgi:succinate dehydrogenase/fumarate reductase flavoprotein subunit
VIPGLYAAGRNAVGVCSRQYVSGLSIADCVYSGRRAGGAAARGEVYSAKDAPAPVQSPPIEAKGLEGLPVSSEAQVADPSPEAHHGPSRRARNEAPYPRQALNRSIRRPGGTTRVSSTSPRGRLSKRAP